ncbi:hypothetical protein JV35_21235 [Pectobacterium betavasculorum]|uniref:Transposase n=1 Tax=Pectobacterium betavasculorum TaxID=55207 RepID=A0ABR4UTV5_9GAMM|nr:hypothetical protein JV35_21235 [Pectobacterium betavasculorum]
MITLLNLKKAKYPLKENQHPQQDMRKTNVANAPTNGLFILTTTISPPSIKELIGMVWIILRII